MSKRIQTTPLLMMPIFPNPTQPGWWVHRSTHRAALRCSTRMNPRSSRDMDPRKSATSISPPPSIFFRRDKNPAACISVSPQLPDIPSERHATVRRTASAVLQLRAQNPWVPSVRWTASRVRTAADMGLGQEETNGSGKGGWNSNA